MARPCEILAINHGLRGLHLVFYSLSNVAWIGTEREDSLMLPRPTHLQRPGVLSQVDDYGLCGL
jgi:hypothetical protein